MHNISKLKLTFILTALVLMTVVWWIMSHGVVVITPPDPSTSHNYQLFDKEGVLVASKTSSKPFKKIVSKGVYHSVVIGEGSSFDVVSVDGFLKKSTLSPKLVQEDKREYVGDNPGFCMSYGGVLYSYECSDPATLALHLPADTSSPTYTVTGDEYSYLPLKGFVVFNGIAKALLAYAQDEDESVGLYDIDSELHAKNPQILKDLAFDETFGVRNLTNGFVVYNEDFSVVKYYSSVSAEPKTLDSPEPNKEFNNPVNVSVSGNTFGAFFSSADEGSDEDHGQARTPGKSTFLVYGDGPVAYEFNHQYTAGNFCGKQRLCMLGSGLLDVYDTSSGKPKRLFSIKDVYQVLNHEDGVLAFTEKHVFYLSSNMTKGYISLSVPNGYCGSNNSGSQYLVCTLNKKGKKSALLVSPKVKDTDNINSKVDKLLGSKAVSDVSVYKNTIYVSPNTGDMVVNGSGQYDYDRSVIQKANSDIKKLIYSTNIDTNKYTVINPFEP